MGRFSQGVTGKRTHSVFVRAGELAMVGPSAVNGPVVRQERLDESVTEVRGDGRKQRGFGVIVDQRSGTQAARPLPFGYSSKLRSRTVSVMVVALTVNPWPPTRISYFA